MYSCSRGEVVLRRVGGLVHEIRDKCLCSEEYVLLPFQKILLKKFALNLMSALRMTFLYVAFQISKNWAMEVLIDHCVLRTVVVTIVQEHDFFHIFGIFTVFARISLQLEFTWLETGIDIFGCFSHGSRVKSKTSLANNSYRAEHQELFRLKCIEHTTMRIQLGKREGVKAYDKRVCRNTKVVL